MPTLMAKITANKTSNANFEVIFQWMENSGLSMLNPALNSITAWNDTGEQVAVTREVIFHKMRNHESGNVQMWFNQGTDLYIS
jgi:hypothetical protein